MDQYVYEAQGIYMYTRLNGLIYLSDSRGIFVYQTEMVNVYQAKRLTLCIRLKGQSVYQAKWVNMFIQIKAYIYVYQAKWVNMFIMLKM